MDDRKVFFMYVYLNQTLCLHNAALLAVRERVVDGKATYINKTDIGVFCYWFKKNQQTGVFSYFFQVLQSFYLFFYFKCVFLRKIVCNRSFDACVNCFIVNVTVFCKLLILVSVTQTYMVLFIILNWTVSTIFYIF